jgi:hypothetical protein
MGYIYNEDIEKRYILRRRMIFTRLASLENYSLDLNMNMISVSLMNLWKTQLKIIFS